jgi:hypothetical protein
MNWPFRAHDNLMVRIHTNKPPPQKEDQILYALYSTSRPLLFLLLSSFMAWSADTLFHKFPSYSNSLLSYQHFTVPLLFNPPLIISLHFLHPILLPISPSLSAIRLTPLFYLCVRTDVACLPVTFMNTVKSAGPVDLRRPERVK